MDNAHHVHLDGAVEPELLGDTRHLVGCEHDAEAKKHVIRESEQTEKQKRCLHKCSQADRRYLFAPLVKAVGIPSGNAEHMLSWVGRMNDVRSRVAEIVNAEIIYT